MVLTLLLRPTKDPPTRRNNLHDIRAKSVPGEFAAAPVEFSIPQNDCISPRALGFSSDHKDAGQTSATGGSQ
jgi:hypothetical protein